ncbi:NRDE family protein [Microbacterium sp. gxy059]|uniref:NRDE family protein n=1 Tax=Microbacterium sp. gxy059 TaxID=2957199 RepID=UPI003D99B1CB
MCTVVFRVPESDADPLLLLAVRDEDPARPWNPLGASWPALPDLIGVQDRRAGGAWLAAMPGAGRLAVTLNRAGDPPVGEDEIVSRGGLALDAAAGRAPQDVERMRGFNLLVVDGPRAEVRAWDGRDLAVSRPGPGVHMLAHDGVDDPRTARIRAWLDDFRAADASVEAWLDVLARTARTPPGDDDAIIRDNRPHGWGTLSTLVCTAVVRPGSAEVRYAALRRPGSWDPLDFG